MNLVNKLFFLGDPKRKIILINPLFQMSIIKRVVGFYLFILSVFYFVSWYFFYQLKENGMRAGIPLDSDYYVFIRKSISQYNLIFFSTSLLSILLIYYFGLILSHRIAGPLYKIDKDINEFIVDKKSKKIVHRKNDFFMIMRRVLISF